MKVHLLVTVAVVFAVITSAYGQTSEPLKIDVEKDVNPWTHLDINNDPQNFQFAIVSDRNGGNRPGIFDDAIRKLNLLQPEFVMSVGDFIKGYTTNTAELKHQWEEFEQLVAKLHVPFFYVPGNHDLSNPVEHEEWAKRFGRKYYHFVYRDVLFLAVNSEDPRRAMSAEQVEYFRKVLEENKNVRWTLVFLHQPLFLRDDDPNDDDHWHEFDKLLQGRKYTVIAGHVHHYTKYVKNVRNYFVLATTGGGSPLRGIQDYGEFDHVVWVTMTDQGPIIANLMLSGIWDENVRTEAMAKLVEPVIYHAIEPQTVFLDPATRRDGHARIRLTNDADVPMHIRLDFQPNEAVDVSTEVIEVVVPPNEVAFADLNVKTKPGVNVVDLDPVPFTWTATFEDLPVGNGIESPKLELNGSKVLGIETQIHAPKRTQPIEIDGDLGEWAKLPHAWRLNRASPPDRKTWTGMGDGSFRFGVQQDEQFVYLGVNVRDEQIVTNPERETWEQDCVEIRLDARPDPVRSRGRGENEGSDILIMGIVPGESPLQPRVYQPEWLPQGTKIAMARTANGYTAEIAIPVAYFDQKQGKPWEEFRLNVAIDDYDRPDSKDFVFLSWRPDWRSEENFEGSGTFVKK